MNMTPARLQVMWEICNDQVEGLSKEDSEYLCEQWWAEIEYSGLTI
jgi:hypothetical protein